MSVGDKNRKIELFLVPFLINHSVKIHLSTTFHWHPTQNLLDNCSSDF